MLIFKCQKAKGDTLIEVLFATAIFSLVAVGGLSVMNQGTASSQRALEITLVRNEIDSQAETLRFLNASYVAAYRSGVNSYPDNTPAKEWWLMQQSIRTTGALVASPFGTVGVSCPSLPQGSYVLDTKNAKFIRPEDGKLHPAQTFSQVVYDASSGQVSSAEGIWIEAVRSVPSGDANQAGAGYIDFNIRACWDSPGQLVPVTIGTIVRLYEPRG
jgi:type II secretory pathway pseudopilin PulG